VLLSRRENRFGAMTLFHCSTIGLSINIFISYHNRYFNIVIFNIRVSIRVRGLNLVGFLSLVYHPNIDGFWSVHDPKSLTRMEKISWNFPLQVPSGKLSHNYGKSQFSMGKSTIEIGHFQ
jgi:hypothetical protein